jgi:hypothetical protein
MLHEGDAGLRITRLDGPMDGGGAAPARQEGGVDVDAAQARHVEHRLRQDQAVGGHHHDIRPRLRDGLARFPGFQVIRLGDGDAMGQGQFLHRTHFQFQAPPRRPVRLGEHQGDVVARLDQGLEGGGGEIRGSGEDEAHGERGVRSGE